MKILTLLIASAAFLAFPASGQDANKPVNSLSWISGCWEMSSNGRTTTEIWGKATTNLMIGTSQSVKDGKTVAYEFLRIVNNGQGLTYVAQPSNAQSPTVFAASKLAGNEVVFENLKHDFPQRIIYRQEKADSLFARIEGKQGEREMSMDFPMKRVPCEPKG